MARRTTCLCIGEASVVALVGAWLVGLAMGALTAVIVAAIVSHGRCRDLDIELHTPDATASADAAGKENSE